VSTAPALARVRPHVDGRDEGGPARRSRGARARRSTGDGADLARAGKHGVDARRRSPRAARPGHARRRRRASSGARRAPGARRRRCGSRRHRRGSRGPTRCRHRGARSLDGVAIRRNERGRPACLRSGSFDRARLARRDERAEEFVGPSVIHRAGAPSRSTRSRSASSAPSSEEMHARSAASSHGRGVQTPLSHAASPPSRRRRSGPVLE